MCIRDSNYIFVHRKYRDSPSVFFDLHRLAPEFDGIVLDSAGIELEPVSGIVVHKRPVLRRDHELSIYFRHLRVGYLRHDRIGNEITIQHQEDTSNDYEQYRLDLPSFEMFRHIILPALWNFCLLYTSDAADEEDSV